ncbi:hypothetical protein MKZ38_003849 [Zalerion maritima]|uniref:Uncharacterized protein n=1 Tax=Zalerion maritima TaxID=339359 RepID=A0AAD5WQD8_9PEZI|nr:hypothetical protein MKZ38_003849 [Zalerion maritima]
MSDHDGTSPAGALTTVFTPPASCAEHTDGLYWISTCMMDGWASYSSAEYYSPGICPSAQTSAGTVPSDFGPPIEDSETAICSGLTLTSLESATLLFQFPVTEPFYYFCHTEDEALTPSIRWNYAVQVRWAESDLADLETDPLNPGEPAVTATDGSDDPEPTDSSSNPATTASGSASTPEETGGSNNWTDDGDGDGDGDGGGSGDSNDDGDESTVTGAATATGTAGGGGGGGGGQGADSGDNDSDGDGGQGPGSGSSDSSSDGLSTGAIIGITIAITVIVLLAVFALILFLRRRKRKRESQILSPPLPHQIGQPFMSEGAPHSPCGTPLTGNTAVATTGRNGKSSRSPIGLGLERPPRLDTASVMCSSDASPSPVAGVAELPGDSERPIRHELPARGLSAKGRPGSGLGVGRDLKEEGVIGDNHSATESV